MVLGSQSFLSLSTAFSPLLQWSRSVTKEGRADMLGTDESRGHAVKWKRGELPWRGPHTWASESPLGFSWCWVLLTCSVLRGSHFLLSEERELDKPCSGMHYSPPLPSPQQRLGVGGRLSAISSLGVSLSSQPCWEEKSAVGLGQAPSTRKSRVLWWGFPTSVLVDNSEPAFCPAEDASRCCAFVVLIFSWQLPTSWHWRDGKCVIWR